MALLEAAQLLLAALEGAAVFAALLALDFLGVAQLGGIELLRIAHSKLLG